MFKNNSGFSPVALLVIGSVVALSVGIVLGFKKIHFPLPNALLSSSKKQQTSEVKTNFEDKDIPRTSSGNREVGNAGELYPYGTMNESTVVRMPVHGDGGVVSATLSGNLTLYVVYPNNIAHGTQMELTPYYSMPTAKKAVPLSNELGYGVDILMENTKYGELPATMFAVFDLDQGKTIQTIRNDRNARYFCDPSISSFNPAACALVNNVPLSEHTSQKYAVVSPIRTEKFANMVTMEPTIPIGYDNLLVVELNSERTLIPQKLSKELLTDLTNANMVSGVGNIHRLEAAVHIVQNSMYKPEHIGSFDSVFSGISPFGDIKIYYELPKYKSLFEKAKSGENLNDVEKAYSIKLRENNGDYSFESYIASNIKNIHGDINFLFGDVNRSYNMITGAALISRWEKEGVDMSDEILSFYEILDTDYEYYKEDDLSYTGDLLISALLLRSGVLSYVPSNQTQSFISRVQATTGTKKMTPDERDQANKDAEKKAKEQISEVCNTDSEQTPLTIAKAMEAAQLMNDDAQADTCNKKMCAQLEKSRKDKNFDLATVRSEMGLDQASCDDPDGSKQREYIRKLNKSGDKRECKTLMKKNLKTFAWNELQCTDFVDENGYIDEERFDTIDEIKRALKNASEKPVVPDIQE